MNDEARFYALRGRRTTAYLGGAPPDEVPVHIDVGADAAETVVGQFAVASLVELVARIHRDVTISCPEVPLALPGQPNHSMLGEHLLASATAIDPYGRFAITRQGDGRRAGVGMGSAAQAQWQMSILGATGVLDKAHHGLTGGNASFLGSGAAACLAAAALLHIASGRTPRPQAVSPWDCADPGVACTGPDHVGPVDVGDTAVVGAGAVAAALAWWLRMFELRGRWAVVDADNVDLPNTSRTMGFTAAHAGWPDSSPRPKAEIVGGMLGAAVHACWYDEWEDDDGYGLVLPLANQFDVRHLVGQRGMPVVLHATTGRDWEAQLHRHIPGRDGCIGCRFRDMRPAAFKCSSGINPHAETRALDPAAADAALPFLSAGAGLLLAGALLRLSHEREWDGPQNWWGWRFLGGRKTIRGSIASCPTGCQSALPQAAIHSLNRNHPLAQLLPGNRRDG